MDNNKCILTYGFNEEERILVNSIKEEESLPEIRLITPSMTSMTLRNIIEGIKLEILSKPLPEEKVMIFNNLSDNELDRAIKSIRSRMKTRPILAVVTPTSIDWTLADLLEHLIEEREFFRNTGKRGTQGE
ncbi:MAG: DUF3783 domain-containing protein [Bacillota bacterium]|nr:DUF3783 domain-containing protein [Bacillota bacterium]